MKRVKGKLTLSEIKGRIPIPKPGGAFKDNKTYSRKEKFAKGYLDKKSYPFFGFINTIER